MFIRRSSAQPVTNSAQFDMVDKSSDTIGRSTRGGDTYKASQLPQVTDEGERQGHFLSADDIDEGVIGKNRVYNCNHSQLADHDNPSGVGGSSDHQY